MWRCLLSSIDKLSDTVDLIYDLISSYIWYTFSLTFSVYMTAAPFQTNIIFSTNDMRIFDGLLF